jgi:hypothetical protein
LAFCFAASPAFQKAAFLITSTTAFVTTAVDLKSKENNVEELFSFLASMPLTCNEMTNTTKAEPIFHAPAIIVNQKIEIRH